MPASVPVIVGVGEIIDRPEDHGGDPRAGLEPLALMEAAARRACDDAGAAGTALGAIDTLAVVTNVFHDYGDTATLLAERLGCAPGRRLVTTWGGNTPQSLLSHLCDDIAADRVGLALIVGAEAIDTIRRLGKAGIPPAWTPPRDTDTPRWGDMRPGTSDLESRHGAREAYVTFALVENAFRAARGQSLATAHAEMAAFGARCARVAADNPIAWFRDAKDAATIGAVGPTNRMVAFPYPKFMNAIMDVNQGAAVLLASEATARRLGLDATKWVWPWAGVDVTEHWYLTERADYHTLPGMRRAGQMLLETVGVGIDAIAHLDLYSCFPIAARLSASMLGMAPDTPRPLTVTGGLPWFGGPGNNFGTHAIAAVVRRLRADREGLGLTHGLGWSLTKHGLGVYGGHAAPEGWRRAGGSELQAWVDAQPHPTVVDAAHGEATIEAYTVVHGRDGAPERGVAILRLPGHRRTMAVLPADRDLLAAMEREEQVGRRGQLACVGERNVFSPA